MIMETAGHVFGYLTFTGNIDKRKNGGVYYECVCRCGTRRFVRLYSLRNATTRSCGCSRRAWMKLVTMGKFDRSDIRPAWK